MLKNYFDFSNLEKDHPLYSTENSSRRGKWKDEKCGEIIEEGVFLKAKNYMLTTASSHNTAIAGVTRRDFIMEEFRDALFSQKFKVVEQSRITSIAHTVKTVHEVRKALIGYDDKRYQLNPIESLPYGHYATY